MHSAMLMRIDPAGDGIWRWLRFDEQGKPLGGLRAGSLADAAAEAAGLKVTVLAPGTRCLLANATIPGRNRQKIMRAVPYALEEQVADEVENLHFALGPAQEEDNWPVAALERRHMDKLLSDAVEAGLDIHQVIPEQLAIPLEEGRIGVVVENDVALVRTGRFSGYAIDAANLDSVFVPGEEEQEPPAVDFHVPPDEAAPALGNYPSEVRTETFSGDPLQLYAEGVNAGSINLLQGDYSRTGDWIRALKPWRTTGFLLLAGVIVSYIVMGVDYFRLDRESERLTARIEQTYRDAFPNARRVVNPRAQMQQQLDTLRKTGGSRNRFLVLVGKSGKVLKEAAGVEIKGANYRGGRLDVDLTANDLQAIDTLKLALAKSGDLKVEIQSAAAGKDKRVKGRLRIEGAGS